MTDRELEAKLSIFDDSVGRSESRRGASEFARV